MKGTIALPVWNSKDIAWLCMESLCRQRVNFEWELIVFEEIHKQQLGAEFFYDYDKRIQAAGGEIIYLTQEKKLTLGQKWGFISRQSKGDFFCLCAADNYYDPNMLADADKAVQGGYDWIFTTRGYFYDIDRKKMILYYAPDKMVGLQMCTTLKVPMKRKRKSVDNWVYKKIQPINPLAIHSESGTLCTNGMNNISKKRYKYFDNVRYPFMETTLQIEDIVPLDIALKLKQCI